MVGPQSAQWDYVSPLTHREISSLGDVMRLTPETVHEALQCMDTVLELFHEHDDNRAIFLRCYRVITRNVLEAIEQHNDFDNPIFFDPAWVARLFGRFATLYFRSLRQDTPDDGNATGTRPWSPGRAWTIANEEARRNRLSVTQHVLLGIDAHINYDLPYALYQNLVAHVDHEKPYTQLYRRKFDHDQVNNILIRSVPEAQDALGDAYGGLLEVMTSAVFSLDDLLAKLGLKYYRERVWWDMVAFLATRDDQGTPPSGPGDREFVLLQDKLDWESGKLAEAVRDSLGPFSRVVALTRRGKFGPFEPS